VDGCQPSSQGGSPEETPQRQVSVLSAIGKQVKYELKKKKREQKKKERKKRDKEKMIVQVKHLPSFNGARRPHPVAKPREGGRQLSTTLQA
jgi:hypothetical protein